jgi:phosphoglycolate phosphatase-like HAD superfamily hydrolase
MSAKLGLEMLSKKYTIIIISSANYEAVKDEWTKFGILKYVDEICTQEMGTKKICIAKMLQKYQPSHALMMGDALGDLDAAIQNAINFYPIKPQKEEESWKEFLDNYEKKFQTNTYVSVQNDINKEFKEFLTK